MNVAYIKFDHFVKYFCADFLLNVFSSDFSANHSVSMTKTMKMTVLSTVQTARQVLTCYIQREHSNGNTLNHLWKSAAIGMLCAHAEYKTSLFATHFT